MLRKLWLWISFSLVTLLIFIANFSFSPLATKAAASNGYWPTYLAILQHYGYNGAESAINPNTVTNLKQHWSFQTGGGISAQPVTANGYIYFGSWDGNEYATDLQGNKIWATNLGVTSNPKCGSAGYVPSVGVASTASVVNITIGRATSVVFVGGGDANFYALNAANGAILWRTSLGKSPNTFIWSSPSYYNGSVYIGVASFGDCPLVPGKVVAFNAVTGQITNSFKAVPNNCIGAGVWGSPTIDPNTGSIYAVTGNAKPCSRGKALGSAIIKLRLSDLSLQSYWQIPASQQINDGDFGSTPTLFNATMGGVKQEMVGVINKNGIFYAFIRYAIINGPAWTVKLANGGACPQCGNGNVAAAAWDGNALYVATGSTTINGQNCQGSLQALMLATGQPIWQDCINIDQGHVLAAVTVVPGVVVITAGADVMLFSTYDGHSLTTLPDTSSGSLYFGSASISQGMLYVGNMDGILHAYGL